MRKIIGFGLLLIMLCGARVINGQPGTASVRMQPDLPHSNCVAP